MEESKSVEVEEEKDEQPSEDSFDWNETSRGDWGNFDESLFEYPGEPLNLEEMRKKMDAIAKAVEHNQETNPHLVTWSCGVLAVHTFSEKGQFKRVKEFKEEGVKILYSLNDNKFGVAFDGDVEVRDVKDPRKCLLDVIGKGYVTSLSCRKIALEHESMTVWDLKRKTCLGSPKSLSLLFPVGNDWIFTKDRARLLLFRAGEKEKELEVAPDMPDGKVMDDWIKFALPFDEGRTLLLIGDKGSSSRVYVFKSEQTTTGTPEYFHKRTFEFVSNISSAIAVRTRHQLSGIPVEKLVVITTTEKVEDPFFKDTEDSEDTILSHAFALGDRKKRSGRNPPVFGSSSKRAFLKAFDPNSDFTCSTPPVISRPDALLVNVGSSGMFGLRCGRILEVFKVGEYELQKFQTLTTDSFAFTSKVSPNSMESAISGIRQVPGEVADIISRFVFA